MPKGCRWHAVLHGAMNGWRCAGGPGCSCIHGVGRRWGLPVPQSLAHWPLLDNKHSCYWSLSSLYLTVVFSRQWLLPQCQPLLWQLVWYWRLLPSMDRPQGRWSALLLSRDRDLQWRHPTLKERILGSHRHRRFSSRVNGPQRIIL